MPPWARARCTTRLKVAVLEAVAWAGRAVLEVAASFGVAWWTVQAVIITAAAAMAGLTPNRCGTWASMSTGTGR